MCARFVESMCGLASDKRVWSAAVKEVATKKKDFYVFIYIYYIPKIIPSRYPLLTHMSFWAPPRVSTAFFKTLSFFICATQLSLMNLLALSRFLGSSFFARWNRMEPRLVLGVEIPGVCWYTSTLKSRERVSCVCMCVCDVCVRVCVV